MAREDMQLVRLLFKKYGAVYVLLVSKDDKHNMTSSTVCLLEDQGYKDKSQNVSGFRNPAWNVLLLFHQGQIDFRGQK